MAWKPPGLVGIRQAVLELAKIRSPEAAIDEYVAPPWPAPPGTGDDPIRRVLAGWDPYQAPRFGREDPAWLAIEAAREEVLQALGDGAINAVVLNDQSGEQNPIPMQLWRSDLGPRVVSSGTVSWIEGPAHVSVLLRKTYGGDVFLYQSEVGALYLSPTQLELSEPPDLADNSFEIAAGTWMSEQAKSERAAGRWIKGEQAVPQCMHDTKCTYRDARAAFKALPANLRRTRGQKHE